MVTRSNIINSEPKFIISSLAQSKDFSFLLQALSGTLLKLFQYAGLIGRGHPCIP